MTDKLSSSEVDWNDDEQVVRGRWPQAICGTYACGWAVFTPTYFGQREGISMVCTNPFTAWASARKHESVQAYERQHSPAFHSEAKTELAALPVSKTEISAQGQEAGEDAKFTPGPWKFYEFPHKDGLHMGYIRPDPEDGMEISHHGDMGRSGAENLANAHLIAAVPELYEALEGCLKPLQAFCELTRFGDEFRKANTVLAAAKKALAKARQGATHAS